ncbi:alpha/beta hydrolase [Actinocorallia longicatena]|uniref:Alpha/beta hydrolase n=1 Tax=Actinocorallia longicatena TaxID=111803 RepID=A0ABP6Q8F5_9ACTN
MEEVVEVDGIPISALVLAVPEPRAVVLALHGGATTSIYFDAPGRPRHSLLRIGAALGYTMIAVDRPGYGRSAGHTGAMPSEAHRRDLVFGAVDRLLEDRGRGAGVFLLAHSRGAMLALQMAGGPRGAELLGLEISGSGLNHTELLTEATRARYPESGPPQPSKISLRDLLWEPSRLYPEDILAGGGIASPAPAFDGEVERPWQEEFPELAAKVVVPFRYTLADHERVWRAGPEGLAEVAALFTASPRVVVNEQADSAHNLSLGLTATAYHLGALAFAEECVLLRERTGRPEIEREGGRLG